jgi:thioredoxin reductase (NADPH)
MKWFYYNYSFKSMGYEMRSKLFFTVFLTLATVMNPFAAQQEIKKEKVDCVIIGGGVGGGTAAIYLGRAGFHPVVIERGRPGGAIVQSDAVENWPGALKIRGIELMERIRQQAEVNGAIFLNEEVVNVDFSKRPFTITTRSLENPEKFTTIQTTCCIIATGSSPNNLHILGESEYWGKGVYNCAICDAGLFKGKRVGVVGGGDAAILESLYLSKIAKEVTIFVRKDQFKGTETLRKEALLSLPNVKVLYQTTLQEIKGNGQNMTKVRYVQGKSSEHDMELDGLFLAIGSRPSTAIFKDQIELDARGYIVLKKGQQTSIEGVYAIGDVVDPFYKQAISAAGDGAKAALAMIQTDLAIRPSQPAVQKQVPLIEKQEIVQKPIDEPVVVEIVSSEQFEKELKTRNMPLVIDFYATWCSPCKRIAPKLESAAQALSGKVKFLKINVDVLSDLTKNYQISSMPTVLYIDRDGVIQDRTVGEPEIGEMLQRLIE